METRRRDGRFASSLIRLLLSSLIFRTAAMVLPVDFLALQLIRESLSDMPGSSFFSSWDFTADPCAFSGVLCASNRVVSLSLGSPVAGSPGLSGRLSPAVGNLSALVELSLVPGRVFGFLPETLSRCKKLRFLALSRNFFSGQVPALLADLTSLQTLDLSSNRLQGPIPRGIGKIPTLKNLILCDNFLSGEIPPLISPFLSRLDLKRNNLSGGISNVVLSPSLQYLSLSKNRLTGTVGGALSRLNRLEYLDLSMNQLSGGIPSRIFSFPISTLLLQRNLFFGNVRPFLPVKIENVDLSYNRLSGEVSPLLSTVQNLYLNNNRFSGKVPHSFVDHLLNGGFRTLFLQHNYLTGFGINAADRIPLGSSLCLQYNCMVLPVATACPVRAGKQKTRPMAQCRQIGKRLKEKG